MCSGIPGAFPCALGSPEYVGEGPQKDGKAKGQFHRGRMQAKSYRWSLMTRASPLKRCQIMK